MYHNYDSKNQILVAETTDKMNYIEKIEWISQKWEKRVSHKYEKP